MTAAILLGDMLEFFGGCLFAGSMLYLFGWRPRK